MPKVDPFIRGVLWALNDRASVTPQEARRILKTAGIDRKLALEADTPLADIEFIDGMGGWPEET